MKIEKKIAWRNQKCNECGKNIFVNKDEENPVYFCKLEDITSFKIWKICEKCFKKIFNEEVWKKIR